MFAISLVNEFETTNLEVTESGYCEILADDLSVSPNSISCTITVYARRSTVLRGNLVANLTLNSTMGTLETVSARVLQAANSTDVREYLVNNGCVVSLSYIGTAQVITPSTTTTTTTTSGSTPDSNSKSGGSNNRKRNIALGVCFGFFGLAALIAAGVVTYMTFRKLRHNVPSVKMTSF